MRPQIVKILTLVCCFFTAIPMFGQGPSASSGPPPPGRGPTFPELPLDTDIAILIIAAIILGSYTAYKKRNITSTPQ